MSKVELGAYIGKRLTLANLSKEDMNGRPGVCVGVEETRLLVKLDPLDPSSKPKTVKVKHKNIVWQKEEEDEEGVVESSGDRAEVCVYKSRNSSNNLDCTYRHYTSFTACLNFYFSVLFFGVDVNPGGASV